MADIEETHAEATADVVVRESLKEYYRTYLHDASHVRVSQSVFGLLKRKVDVHTRPGCTGTARLAGAFIIEDATLASGMIVTEGTPRSIVAVIEVR